MATAMAMVPFTEVGTVGPWLVAGWKISPDTNHADSFAVPGAPFERGRDPLRGEDMVVWHTSFASRGFGAKTPLISGGMAQCGRPGAGTPVIRFQGSWACSVFRSTLPCGGSQDPGKTAGGAG